MRCNGLAKLENSRVRVRLNASAMELEAQNGTGHGQRDMVKIEGGAMPLKLPRPNPCPTRESWLVTGSAHENCWNINLDLGLRVRRSYRRRFLGFGYVQGLSPSIAQDAIPEKSRYDKGG